jgi:predicted Fe-Mo cluster-binding NifX family protein
MKVAIPIFENRISPRFDFSPEVWIVEVEDGKLVNHEKISVAHLNLSQRMEKITSNGVHKIICGGIDGFSRDQLKNRGIDVVQDIIGEAEVVIDRFMRGRLQSGFCCERRRDRGFCMRKNNLRRRRIV